MSTNDRVGRRAFLRGGSGLALGLVGSLAANAEEIKPKAKVKVAKPEEKPPTPVACAVIGLGDQGREILKALAGLPGADVKLVCDSYPNIHERAVGLVPKTTAVGEYR